MILSIMKSFIEIYPCFALIGRDTSRLCSDWLDHDVADARSFTVFLWLKGGFHAQKGFIKERSNIMIPTNQSTALMELDQ